MCRRSSSPRPSALIAQLWALKNKDLDLPGLNELSRMSGSGRTSAKVEPGFDPELYLRFGFRLYGQRAVRLDILERLADLIRPALAWRPGALGERPAGAIPDGRGFTVTPAMTSLLGASGQDFAAILQGLGYRMERRPKPVEEVPSPPEALPDWRLGGVRACVAATLPEKGPNPANLPNLDPRLPRPRRRLRSRSLRSKSRRSSHRLPTDLPSRNRRLRSLRSKIRHRLSRPWRFPPWKPLVRRRLLKRMMPPPRSGRPHRYRRRARDDPRDDRGVAAGGGRPRRPEEQRRRHAGVGAKRQDGPRRQRRHGGPPDGDQPASGVPETAEARPPRRQPDRPFRGKRPRPVPPEQQDRPQQRPEFRERTPRERPIDPDSPFAALAALKGKLEKSSRE